MKAVKHELGKFTFHNQIDITDPCYDKDVWCRTQSKCKPGEYVGLALERKISDWGNRIIKLAIYHSDLEEMPDCQIELCPIGVDAGLAGFFDDKPDFDDKTWGDLCDNVFGTKNYGKMDCGFWSSSGLGDGEYQVYAHENEEGERDAFEIIFL